MSVTWTTCRVCERLYQPGHIWILVEQFGAYPKQWEFCSVECLGSYFEAPTLDEIRGLPDL